MNLIGRLCEKVAQHLPRKVLTDGETPYLARYYLLRSAWLPESLDWFPSIYLHHFYRGDNDDELHNHPWRYSIALILTGGYHEERRVGDEVHSRILWPGMVNFILANDYHRIELLDRKNGAWTLFIAGDRTQDWGFWHPVTKTYLPWGDQIAKRAVSRSGFAPEALAGDDLQPLLREGLGLPCGDQTFQARDVFAQPKDLGRHLLHLVGESFLPHTRLDFTFLDPVSSCIRQALHKKLSGRSRWCRRGSTESTG